MNLYKNNKKGIHLKCKVTYNMNTDIINFYGHCEYYRKDLFNWISKNQFRMFIDMGAEIYVLRSEIINALKHLHDTSKNYDTGNLFTMSALEIETLNVVHDLKNWFVKIRYFDDSIETDIYEQPSFIEAYRHFDHVRNNYPNYNEIDKIEIKLMKNA